MREIEFVMRDLRRIGETEEDDFTVMDMKQVASMLTGITGVLTGLLAAVAAVSLLVGGIGIMNIMLVSVTERTREIGSRRARGAKRKHIVTQFLVETMVLSGAGGIVGGGVGLFIPWVVERFADLETIVTPAAPILALGISVLVGVVFGLYPAGRAATMDPVEALRHE